MRLAGALLFVVITASANCATVALTSGATLQLANGSITLDRGTVVEVLGAEGAMLHISYRNLKGQIPAKAVETVPRSGKAFSGPPEYGPAEDAFVKAPNVFAEELRIASQKIVPIIKAADSLTVQGKFDEANTFILSAFPEAIRTPVEAFVLGNVLFRAEPRLSFDLHRKAAEAMPDEADVLLEWALEQHRAKDYTGAAKTYATFSKLRPNYAPALGLAAECAIRRGKIVEAVNLWKKSEGVTGGTLQQLEALVCEVNGEVRNDAKRVSLMRRAEGGDESAAGEMLLHDCSWSTDWWNNGPSYRRLENDLALVKRTFPTPGADLRAAVCTAEWALQSHREEKADVATLLERNGFSLDDHTTFPNDGRAVSRMLSMALTRAPSKVSEARAKWGDAILERARSSKDPEMYKAAAYLFVDTDRLEAIDQEGWDATHDARFASSRVVSLALQHKLTIADPLLQRALKEFPENSEIAHVAVELAMEAKSPVQPYLVEAIKAEYTRFSAGRPGVDAPRPGAHVLRGYFALLANLPVKESSVAATD